MLRASNEGLEAATAYRYNIPIHAAAQCTLLSDMRSDTVYKRYYRYHTMALIPHLHGVLLLTVAHTGTSRCTAQQCTYSPKSCTKQRHAWLYDAMFASASAIITALRMELGQLIHDSMRQLTALQ
eukprot:13932-Heterococcus_DN1.PRE.7